MLISTRDMIDHVTRTKFTGTQATFFERDEFIQQLWRAINQIFPKASDKEEPRDDQQKSKVTQHIMEFSKKRVDKDK